MGNPLAAQPGVESNFRARMPPRDPTAVCFLFDMALPQNPKPET